MKTFDVQNVEIHAHFDQAFAYIADSARLPEWTQAFRSVADGRARRQTPNGSVDIGLQVQASREHGTIDWRMTFPDGSVARACSRIVALDAERSIYSFMLPPPPVPLEQVEGAVEQQAAILRDELLKLQSILARG